jgi:hypothetical protein
MVGIRRDFRHGMMLAPVASAVQAPKSPTYRVHTPRQTRQPSLYS